MGKVPDQNCRTNSVVLVIIDVIVMVISVFFSFRVSNFFHLASLEKVEQLFPRLAAFSVIFLASFWINGVYDSSWQRALDALVRMAKSILLGAMFMGFVCALAKSLYIPFNVLFITVLVFATLIAISHYCFRLYYVKAFAPDARPEKSIYVTRIYSLNDVLEKNNGVIGHFEPVTKDKTHHVARNL